MNKDFAIRKERLVEQISQILNVDQEVDARIKNTIKEIGIEAFLFNIDTLDFSDEMKERVNALKDIIQLNDIYGKAFYSAKGGNMDDK